MNNTLKSILMWLPAIVMMCIIFMFSLEPADSSSRTSGEVCTVIAEITIDDFEIKPEPERASIIESMQHAVRKTAHFTEFALLGMAFLLPLWYKSNNKTKAAAFALILSAVYACSDEFHQMFTPNRSAQITDVCLDTFGALIGILFACIIIFIVKKIKGNKKSPAR